MLLRTLTALALIAAPLTGLVTADAAAQARTDWTRTVAALPNGAFQLGNPAAKTTLVEYFSYTCIHCKDFAEQGMGPIKQGWIRSGAVKMEFRNWIRDPFDLVAALLARCGGPTSFLANHEAIYAGYDAWLAKAQPYAQAHPDMGDPKNYSAAAFADIADKLGLSAIVAKNGIDAARQRTCLGDQKALSTILGLTAGSWDAVPDFPGTPTFLLNGKLVPNTASWDRLKPHLPALPAPAK